MVVALAKTGEEEHMRRLIEEGQAYMQPLTYFRKLENDAARGDRLEGMMYQGLPGGQAMVQIGPVQIKDFVSIRCWDRRREELNVFCLHGLARPEPSDLPRMALGSCAVMIRDPDAFFKRALQAASAFRQKAVLRRCQYYNAESLNGHVGVFQKSNQYSGQKEWRLVLSPGFGGPIILPLGSLRSIASFHRL